LQVVLKRLVSPPAAPSGWTIVDAAYEITARDREREVTRLDSSIELSFKAPAGQAVVMYHDGTQWVMVESERGADGSLVAKTDHLTPYAVLQPKNDSTPKQAAGYGPPPGATATVSPTAAPPTTRPTDTPEPGASAAAAGSTTPGTGSPTSVQRTPSATPTLLGGSESEAKSALEAAIAKYKGRQSLVVSASSYSTIMPGNTIATLYYGTYGGVNEVVTSGPTSNPVQGGYAFLSEPKTAMPANSTDAQTQLAAIFPGATGLKYKPVQESATAYIYSFNSGATVSTIGFSLVNGVPVAFMAYGTWSYGAAAEQASRQQ
jgi:hypothetical protein